MRILLLENKQLLTTILPTRVEGNYWITNENNKNLLNIEAIDGKWILKSNKEVKLIKDETIDNEIASTISSLEIIPGKMYYCQDMNTETIYKIYCDFLYDNSIQQYKYSLETLNQIVIGNNNKNSLQASLEIDINCPIEAFSKNQIIITFKDNNIFITNTNPRIKMYINGTVYENKRLLNGEQVFIEGLKFYFIGEFFLINNAFNPTLNSTKFFLREMPQMKDYDFSQKIEENLTLFKKEDYFQRPPRINRTIEFKEIKIDEAPSSYKFENMPFIFTIGTMLTLGATSMLTGITAVSKVLQGESTIKEQYPSLITCGTMIIGMILLPLIRNIYIKHRNNKKEKLRKQRYKEYLNEKRNEIQNEINLQMQILKENNLGPEDCARVILNKERNLWERKTEHPDFLNVRLGLGILKPQIKINYPEKHFTVEKDKLEEELFNTVESLKDMENVPITVDLKQKICCAFIGKFDYVSTYLDNIILELITSQSYDILKLVVLTNNKNKHFWEKYKNIPYIWDNEREIRLFGSNQNDIIQISTHLTEIYNQRQNLIPKDKDNKEVDLRFLKPYYLIITDAIESLENVGIISSILDNPINLGFSILINTKNMDSLPNECNTFINLANGSCALFEQELVSNRQISFTPDNPTLDLEKCLRKICNIPIDVAEGKFILPQTYSFLEMYDVGNVNQLNSINRWKENDVIASLQAPIGINEQGELFKLDIHEKFHGPHGLVAGMTGSGKSEWLITYILSMAINYHPDEVQFVIIDYKGGGLALVFENRETGFKLPHLAGTITNLDEVEINRALASIQSELKRRQKLFNEARDSLNESTIDIYKYQRLYREGKVKEPMSHLIIISDEFAELKSQQPEFMKELISTARIGRALGVHLILATQKPSGVVDDQIWSNARFRVCLKVQEQADSNDMIKRPDAAMLKEPGRFFLQVGYNEYFAKGQAAYAGNQYYETEKRTTPIDTSLQFINDLGYSYKIIENKKNDIQEVHKGEELPNILNYIKETAEKVETHVRQLWLERIPDVIFHDNLKTKYNFVKEDFELNPIIGEYDAPEIQKQGLLTLPLTKEGNTIIYGISGSGKDNLLCTITYSLISMYSVKEVNIFILDFGAEILLAYNKAPHVGEVLTSDNAEQIDNLFKYLVKNLEIRKNMFQDYNGDIKTYNTQNTEVVPNLVIIINNYENFQELYPDCSELVTQITRDSAKYGIIFILTTNSSNALRIKLTQNFPEQIALQLKDKFDYTSVLGNTGGMIPSKVKGRGLVKLNKIYEFQSAYITNEQDQINFIKEYCQKLAQVTKERAIKIPILPEIVNIDFVKNYITDLTKVPIGVYKESLNIALCDFLHSGFNLISSQDSDLLSNFINSLLKLLSLYKNCNTFIIDANAMLESAPSNMKLFNNKFDDLMNELIKFLTNINENNINNYGNTLFIFIGVNNLKNNLSSDLNLKLEEIFNKIKNIKQFNSLIVDTVSNIQKIEYDTWYKDCVNNTRAIWLGSGIDSQFTIKLSKVTRDLREEVPENFGYIVEKGKAYLTKFIDIKEGDNHEQQ